MRLKGVLACRVRRGSLDGREVLRFLGTRTTHLRSHGGSVGDWRAEKRQPTFREEPVGWILGVGMIVIMIMMAIGVFAWKVWEFFV